MSVISLLPEDVRNFIACGEVIESPHSVVKELIENSIDAGAKKILLKIKNAGLNLISVSDDGHGIPFEDLPLSVSSFATSKISKKEDLSNIKTLGFRGEALASIANVSKMKITSSTQKEGGILVVEGGKILLHEKAKSPKGTTVEVKNLFFNAPVRKRFLKSTKAIYRNILNTFTTYAISYSNIQFRFESDGKKLFEFFEDENIPSRIKRVFKFENFEVVEKDTGLVKLRIFIYPNELKSRKTWQMVFLNQRPIFSAVLSKAFENATSEYFSPRHPPFFAFLEMPQTLFDINVHPTKREVRFQNPQSLYDLFYHAVKEHFSKESPVLYETQEPHRINAQTEEATLESFITPKEEVKEEKSIQKKIDPVRCLLSNGVDWGLFKFIGISHKKFLFFSLPDAVAIVDFHAACERINYEKLKESFKKDAFPSQNVLIPIEVKLTDEEIEILKEKKNELEKTGLHFKVENGKVIISALPAGFKGDEKKFLEEITDELSGNIFSSMDEVLKVTACHISFRAGDDVKREDAEQIIKELKKCAEPLRCPHGRPTIVFIPVSELETRFMR